MSSVTPAQVLKQVAEAVPTECLDNIIVVGSLAAGYDLIKSGNSFEVRTKDIDCVLSPRHGAALTAEVIVEKLMSAGWRQRTEGEYGKPGSQLTHLKDLPAVRLYPPDTNDWFLELLTEPDTVTQSEKSWMRVIVGKDHYGLVSFPYLSVATHNPIKTPMGVSCARAELMALSLLLEHPHIGDEKMKGEIEGRELKRSNKDLGRVLAIAWLSLEKDEDALGGWVDTWVTTLRDLYPTKWKNLAIHVGSGLRQLLTSPNDLNEAWHTCNFGLLASRQVTQDQLERVGKRVINDVVDPIERIGQAEAQ